MFPPFRVAKKNLTRAAVITFFLSFFWDKKALYLYKKAPIQPIFTQFIVYVYMIYELDSYGNIGEMNELNNNLKCRNKNRNMLYEKMGYWNFHAPGWAEKKIDPGGTAET